MPYIGKSPEMGVRTRYYYTVSADATSVSGSDDNSKTLTFSDGEYVDVYINGVLQVAGTDYNTTTANTIAGLSALLASDVVEVVVYDVFSVFSGDISGDLDVGGNLNVNSIIQTTTSDGDMIFKGNDGGSTVTALTLDMSELGAATFDASPMTVQSTAPMIDFMETGVTDSNTRLRHNAGNFVIQKLSDDKNTATDVIKIDNGELAVTMPTQPAFLAKPASQQNNVSSDDTIAFGTEIFDQGSDFASNTFTAPITGRYQLSVALRMDNIDAACDYFRIGIHTSNRQYYYLFEPDIGTSSGQDITRFPAVLSILADMDANDTATVVVNFSGGTAQTDIITDSYFSGFLAC